MTATRPSWRLLVIVTLVLVFTHTIGSFWWLIPAVGWGFASRGGRRKRSRVYTAPLPFVPPAPPPPPVAIQPAPVARPAAAPSVQITERLHALVDRIATLVSSDILALVKSIVGSIETILPMLDNQQRFANDPNAYTIRQTALHYLPDTIAAYFKLPPAYRTTQPLSDGKTARVHLIEQLTTLDDKMKEIVRNLVANDAQELLENGNFLRERFAPNYFKPV